MRFFIIILIGLSCITTNYADEVVTQGRSLAGIKLSNKWKVLDNKYNDGIKTISYIKKHDSRKHPTETLIEFIYNKRISFPSVAIFYDTLNRSLNSRQCEVHNPNHFFPEQQNNLNQWVIQAQCQDSNTSTFIIAIDGDPQRFYVFMYSKKQYPINDDFTTTALSILKTIKVCDIAQSDDCMA